MSVTLNVGLSKARPRSSEHTQDEHVECSLKRARPRSSEISQVWLMNARSSEFLTVANLEKLA